jgi:hypothetical protein
MRAKLVPIVLVVAAATALLPFSTAAQYAYTVGVPPTDSVRYVHAFVMPIECLYGYSVPGTYGCNSYGYSSSRLVVGIELWTETNGKAGLQRAPACADGSTPSYGSCPGGGALTPSDTANYGLARALPP